MTETGEAKYWMNKGNNILTSAFTIAALLGFLLLFGPLRRFTRSSFCKLCLLASFLALAPLINNILGKIDPILGEGTNNTFIRDLIVMYLLILYAGQNNVNALSLQDNNDYKRYTVEFLLMNAFFIVLWYQSFTIVCECYPNTSKSIIRAILKSYGWKVSLLWLAMFLKFQERKWAFFYASRSGIARVCRAFADYMKSEHQHDHDAQHNNRLDPANSLHGYKYLIEPPSTKPLITSPSCQTEVDPNNIVTLDTVWQCDGILLSSNDNLKDLCLSYSFFWLLLRRFAGFRLHETTITEARDKAWRLIRDGLVNRLDNDHVERAFSVIEIELMFLYDFFYTKYYAAFKGGLAQFIKKCIIVLSIVIISTSNFSSLKHLYPAKKELSTTLYTVMVAATLLEMTQVILLITSKWCIVKAICCYVKKELWKTQWGGFFEMSVKILTVFPTLKPWSRKLGQYSLLTNYAYNPSIYRLGRSFIKTLVDIPRPGQKESNSVKLSIDVKVALFSSLYNNGPKLPNGIQALRSNQVAVQLFSWACELETQAHVILVWHIATSFCEKKIDRKPRKSQDSIYKNFTIAKDLSRYCAYLVAFAPELLRDHDHVTMKVFDQVIVEAKNFFTEGAGYFSLVGSKSMLDKLDEVTDEEPNRKQTNIERGALLGMRLLANIQDEEKRWKVLAEFWAELLLFLAPSEKNYEHAEYLVRGGELITHLWALLTHAGITGADSDFKPGSSLADAV